MKQEIILHNMQKMAYEHPQKLCVYEKNRMLTYREFWCAINNCALTLKNSKIRKGDRVAIIADQSIDFLVNVSAIHLVGAVVVPLERKLPLKRVSEILENLETR